MRRSNCLNNSFNMDLFKENGKNNNSKVDFIIPVTLIFVCLCF